MLNRVLLCLLLASVVWANIPPESYKYIHPKPGSIRHHAQTTIILKMSKNDVAAFSFRDIAVTGEKSGTHSGELIRQDNTVIFKPEFPFNSNEKVSVSIHSPESFQFNFYTAERIEPPTILPAVKKVSAAHIHQNVHADPPRLINGVAVPGDFPYITTIQSGETAPGRAFFASTFFGSDGVSNYIFIIENDGTPYFYRRYTTNGLGSADFHLNPNGLLSFYKYQGSEDGIHIILDEHFTEIDTFRAANGYRTDNHEMVMLENGHALLTAEDDVKIDMSQIVDGGNPNATVQGNYAQEVDDKGNVYWEWRSWDHLEIADSDENLRANNIDYVHLNSIGIDYDGNYVLSLRNYNQVVKIDKDTGDIIWRLGGVKNDFTINDPIPISRQHCMKPVVNAPNHYTIYDNGNKRWPNETRAVEYSIDMERMVANKVWEYDYDKAGNQDIMGAVQRQTNGNTYIDWSAWPNGRACEVDSENNLVWEVETGGIASYRSWRFDWDGEMQQPYLVLENLNDVIRLIFNKFGDANVDHYNIYYGTSPDFMQLYSSTPETWIDIAALELTESGTYWFTVTAVNHDDIESLPSSIEKTQVNPIEANSNIVRNSGFDSALHWTLDANNGAQANGQIQNGEYHISISNGGNNDSDITLTQNYIPLLNGKDYIFEFDAYSTNSRAIQAVIESTEKNPENHGQIGLTALSRRPQHFKYTFLMNHITDTQARIAFKCGGNDNDVYIDNVQVYFIDLESQLTALHKGWSNEDIGAVSSAGLAGQLGERVIIRGSGSDIWSNADEFHFAYTMMKGDGEAIARVYSMTGTNEWAKAGVMMREMLSPNSKHAMMVETPDNGMSFQRRVRRGEESYHTPGSAISAPGWVRLVRLGNIFTGYESTDGINWNQVASEEISMKEIIYVGLAVTSHNDGVLCEAQFEEVEILNDYAKVDDEQIPQSLVLYPAYPNPFNAGTRIQFDLPEQSHVKMTIFDIRGREIEILVDETLKPGQHKIQFNADGYASGVYFYKLKTEMQTRVGKMMLVR